MAYLMGAALGIATGAIIDTVQQRNVQQRVLQQQTHWRSPLSRLGRCGIFSLRVTDAVGEVVSKIAEADTGEWSYANDVRCDGSQAGVDQLVIYVDGRAAVIQAILHADYPAAVRLADLGVQAVSLAAGRRLPVSAYVCRVDAADEPRTLPGPSGSEVTVTGLPWLSGLLRRRLVSDPDDADGVIDHDGGAPSGLRLALVDASWRAKQKAMLVEQSLRALPAHLWWSAVNLYLDDQMTDSVDFVLAGPGGVFVIEFARTARMEDAFRAVRQSQRLRQYLPYSAIVPMVVCEQVTNVADWPARVDVSAHPVPALQPDHMVDYLLRATARGIGPHELATLNAPWPGWYRQVWFGPGGSPNLRYGWTTGG